MAEGSSAVGLLQCIALAVSTRPFQPLAQLGKNPAGGTGVEFLGTPLQLRACFRNLFGLGHTGRNAICCCSGEFALLALAATIHEHALYRLIHRSHVPLERTAL